MHQKIVVNDQVFYIHDTVIQRYGTDHSDLTLLQLSDCVIIGGQLVKCRIEIEKMLDTLLGIE